MVPCFRRFNHCLTKNTPREVAGRIFGYNQSFQYIGNVIGPLVGSSVAAHFGYGDVFLVVAGFIFINVLISFYFNRKMHGEKGNHAN